MIKITNRQGNQIIFIIVIIFIFLTIYSINRTNTELKKNGIIVNATITDVIYPSKDISEFQYIFYYQGKKYTDEGATGIQTKWLFIGKSFPALFSPKTGNSELLMPPKNFEKYNVPYPDSLQWILQYRVN
jgi:hypothetical protein